jgi:hypothetical protein
MFRPVMVILKEVQSTKKKHIKMYTAGGLSEQAYIYKMLNHVIKHGYLECLKKISELVFIYKWWL